MSLSELVFGCEPLGGTDWGSVDFQEIEKAIEFYWDNGGRVFDTANVYGLGMSEIRLGSILGKRTNEAVIITKGGVEWENTPSKNRATTRKNSNCTYIQTCIDDSLRRLSLDTLPIYLLHWHDESTSFESLVNLFEDNIQQGKIKRYGFCNLSKEKITQIKKLTNNNEIFYQGSLNLISDSPTKGCFYHAYELGFKTISYGVLAQGLLSGKYKGQNEFPVNDRRSRLPHFQNIENSTTAQILRNIEQIGDKLKCSPAQVAISLSLLDPMINYSIVGIKNLYQAKQMVECRDHAANISKIKNIIPGLSELS